MNMQENTAQEGEHVTPEMAQLIYKIANAMLTVDQFSKLENPQEHERIKLKQARTLIRDERRKIRYRLFRIRDAVKNGVAVDPQYDMGLKNWIEIQFQQDMTWVRCTQEGVCIGGFTFEWDIASKEPLKAVKQFAWDGKIEKRSIPEVKNGNPTGKITAIDVCDPPAFTQQP